MLDPFFDTIERPFLSAWKAYAAARQRDYDLRMREVRRAWRAWTHRLRWQRQLARDRRYTLGLFLLLILACGLLVWSITR